MGMEGTDFQSKDEAIKLRIAVQCAKAALLLSSLNSLNLHLHPPNSDNDDERETLKGEIVDLKIELVNERFKCKRIKQWGLVELIIQMVLLMFLLSFSGMLVLSCF